MAYSRGLLYAVLTTRRWGELHLANSFLFTLKIHLIHILVNSLVKNRKKKYFYSINLFFKNVMQIKIGSFVFD